MICVNSYFAKKQKKVLASFFFPLYVCFRYSTVLNAPLANTARSLLGDYPFQSHSLMAESTPILIKLFRADGTFERDLLAVDAIRLIGRGIAEKVDALAIQRVAKKAEEEKTKRRLPKPKKLYERQHLPSGHTCYRLLHPDGRKVA
jgi:hypothetical protein